MVPALTTGGPSFKGAALYYLHDKRQAGEAERLTSDRVAWTQTVNLPTDDPERAWRMMATTAMKADELKAAAGVKSTGRKLTKPALAYSLSWHPDEKPTQAEQIDAARETLKLLGLSEHQALIVCHKDEPHAHVHVVVNRVHPAEGKAATLSKSKLILSEWAQAYEQKRGKLLCPKRAENNAKRQQGEHVRDDRTPRTTFEFNRAAGAGISAAILREEQKQRDGRLAQAGRDMHDRHRKQWGELKRVYQATKGGLYERADQRQQERAAEIKAAFKTQWTDLFRQQRNERRAFDQREGSVLGTVVNMVRTAREARRTSEVDLSMLAMTVLVFSKAERVAVFEREQERQRKALASVVSAAMGQGRGGIRRAVKIDASRLLDGFLKQCGELRQTQQGEREALKLAWAKRNQERKAALAPVRDRAAKWARLEEMGRKDQGMTPGLYRGRELRRE